MVEHVTARRAEEPPSRLATRFPLWAGDVPVSDSQARPVEALCEAPSEAPDEAFAPDSTTARSCTSLSQLALRKRQVTPPPLPKGPAKLAAPPLASVVPAPEPVRTDLVGPERGQESAILELPENLPPVMLVDRAQQLPCWLTSLVLHLCLVISLNSYVIYVGGRYGGGTSSSAAPGSIICVTTGSLESAASERSPDLVPSAELAVFDPSPPEVELIRPTPSGVATADKIGPTVGSGVPLAVGAPQRGSDGPLEPPPAESYFIPQDNDDPAAPPQRRRSPHGQHENDPATTTRAVPPIDRVPSPSADAASEPKLEERAKDAIVNQFIEYDLGRLRGAEAARALHEFESLRSDSIPSLVRGLNRAARITGTCPVMVLSQKLEQLLRETDDPAMVRYAFENLGATCRKAPPITSASRRCGNSFWAGKSNRWPARSNNRESRPTTSCSAAFRPCSPPAPIG